MSSMCVSEIERELQEARARVESLQGMLRGSDTANQADFQRQISTRLSTEIFAPYSQGPQSLQSSSRLPSLTTLQLGGRSRRVVLPTTDSHSGPRKRSKPDETEIFWFTLLGDPTEEESPSHERCGILEKNGLMTAKLVTSKHGNAQDFLTDFQVLQASLSDKCASWEICYSQSKDKHLRRFLDPTVTCEQFISFQKRFRVNMFYLRPKITVVPLENVETEDTTVVEDSTPAWDEFLDDDQPREPSLVVTVVERCDNTSPVSVAEMLGFMNPLDFLLRARRGVRSTTRIQASRIPTFPSADMLLDRFGSVDANPINNVFVVFDGEPGVDGGALSKEFFWTCHRVLAEDLVCGYPLFDGCENHKNISNNEELVLSGKYVALAKVMLMSFMTIGVLSPGLSKPVYNYIIGSEEIIIPDPLDFPDYEDQVVARIIKDVKPGHHTTNDDLLLARSSLEKIIGLPRGLLTPSTAMYYYREFCDHMIINRRSEALNVIRDIIYPSPAAAYLRTNPQLYISVCPSLETFEPSVSVVMQALQNPTNDRIEHNINEQMQNLEIFLESLSLYNYSVKDFLELVTASPVLTRHGFYIKVPSPNCRVIYAKACHNEIYIPAKMDYFEDFLPRMLEALDIRNRNFTLT